jgi:MoaA/NifB/PqqE/SkfB family radical SAM enzyme
LVNTVPRLLRVEASSFCQLRCPSCPTTSGAIDPTIGKRFLRFADFRRLIDLNPSVARIELSNYGEIFLNPELVNILQHAHERRVAITVRNGANLNHAGDELLEALVRCRVEVVTCSIDGASQDTYARYRVRGDFAAVIGNIERINHYKQVYGSQLPRLEWQFVVFGHNEHEIPVARDMAKKLGMEFRTKMSWDAAFSPIRNADFVRAQTGAQAVTREEFARLNGREYLSGICGQLWDAPQINWDGKLPQFLGRLRRQCLSRRPCRLSREREARLCARHAHRSPAAARRHPLHDLRSLSGAAGARRLDGARQLAEKKGAQPRPRPFNS